MSAWLALMSVLLCVPSTIHNTVRMRAPVNVRNSSANSAATRNISALNILIELNESISDATHGLYGVYVAAGVETRAEPAHMTFHHTGVGVEMDVPDILEQHFACHCAIDVANQILQEA